MRSSVNGWLVFAGLVLLPSLAAGGDPRVPPARPAVDAYGDPLPEGALARLGTHRFRPGGWGQVVDCQLSPDGRLLAVVNNHQVALLDATTGKHVWVLHEGINHVGVLAFTCDGTILAGADQANLYLWDVATGRTRRQLPYPKASEGDAPIQLFLTSLSFSADGKHLAAGFCSAGRTGIGNQVLPTPGLACLWDVASGVQRRVLCIPPDLGQAAALSPDGKVLAMWAHQFHRPTKEGGPAMALELWDVATGKRLWQTQMDAGTNRLLCAVFSPDRRILAAAPGKDSVWLLDVATGKVARRLTGPEGVGAPVQLSPDGATVAAAVPGGAVQLWERESGKRLVLHKGPFGWPGALVYPTPGKMRVCGRNGQAACVWDLPGGRLLSPSTGHEHTLREVAFVAAGKGLVSVGDDGKICHWDRACGKELKHHYVAAEKVHGQPGFFNARMTLSPDGKLLAGHDVHRDPVVHLWDTATGKLVRSLPGPQKAPAEHLAFSPDGRRLATEDMDHAVHVWDLATGALIRRLDPPPGALNMSCGGRLAFSSDGRLLAVLEHLGDCADGHVFLWDLAAGKEVRHFQDRMPMSVALSPDSNVLATAGRRGGVLWDVATGQQLCRLEDPGPDVWHLAFSPDGRTLAGGWHIWKDTEPGVGLWETATGQLRCKFGGHRVYVSCLRFSLDGALLASGSEDTTALLWDVTGRHLAARAAERKPEELWTDLASMAAEPAFRATGALLDDPATALALFRERLRPARLKDFDEAAIGRLIADLDDPSFRVREKAARELQQTGKPAVPLLRERLPQARSLEQRRRMEAVLTRLVKALPRSEELQALRAVEVLERIGNAEARELLTRLTHGDGRAYLTEHARAALKRLRSRP
jgi:WD40 repeat protein